MVASKALNCVFLEKYKTAPSPSRDYYGLKVTSSQISIYVWKIARQSGIFPIVRRESLVEFLHDTSTQTEILKIFGDDILNATLDIVGGNQDYLSHLPPKLLQLILQRLPLKDIATVAQTCKNLASEIKKNNALWKSLFYKYIKRPLSIEEKKRGEIFGWKKFLMAEMKKSQSRQKLENGRLSRTSVSHAENVKKKPTTTTSKLEKPQKKKVVKQPSKSVQSVASGKVTENIPKNLKIGSSQKSFK